MISKYFFKSWSPYYQEKLYKQPRTLLLQALQFCNTHHHTALDLGAGAGNDTAYLLQHGWSVWANDKEREALDIIASRKDILPYLNHLTYIHSSFTNIPWNDLPLFNLIYASYALPFLTKEDFYIVWNHVINQLQADGIIALHLFGDQHQAFNAWQRQHMSFFNKQEVSLLLKNLDIKILEESCERNDRGIMDHSFTIIVQKR
jgi:trans-aconitate methyltransferase